MAPRSAPAASRPASASPPSQRAVAPAVETAAPAAAAAAATAASSAAAPARLAQVSPDWERSVSAWLAAHRVYPDSARRRDEEGNVTLRFTVAPSGQVTGVSVLRSSGSPRLDAAALDMLRGATLPPFDPHMAPVPITTTVQIRYALED